MPRRPDRAVAGKMGEKVHHPDLRAIFRGEAGQAITSFPRASPARNVHADVRVGGEKVARHGGNITRTCWRVKVMGARKGEAGRARDGICSLYSMTRNQEAVRRLFAIRRVLAGNLPDLPVRRWQDRNNEVAG